MHATVVHVDGTGLLIRGPSGSGKSSLALALIERVGLSGKEALLVSDDQVLLETQGKVLIAHVPPTIAGLIEIWPLGPRPIAYRPQSQISLVIELVAIEQIARVEEVRTIRLQGIDLPVLRLPARSVAQCLPALLSVIEHKVESAR